MKRHFKITVIHLPQPIIALEPSYIILGIYLIFGINKMTLIFISAPRLRVL